MQSTLNIPAKTNRIRTRIPEIGYCEEKHRLLREFLNTIQELNAIQAEQTRAVIEGDDDFTRFDVLLHLAQERKDQAKYAWIAHVEEHRCHGGE
jgi:hypothetical protein